MGATVHRQRRVAEMSEGTTLTAVDVERPAIKTVSGYINVTTSLDLEPPLKFRRWFAQVADGAFCLYNTERAHQCGESPMFTLVLDKVTVDVQPTEVLQLTYQAEKGAALSGISFQVRLVVSFCACVVTHHTSPHALFPDRRKTVG